jgi:hypothetical protein
MANLRYILRQAGTPSDFAAPLELNNGILLDEPWMQTHSTKLAVTRDCSDNWPFNDGLIFKTLHPVQCGATCVLNNQGFPIIYGVIQRILGSVMTAAGRPKVYILQWLPNPVAAEKILDAYKWPNLAVVRGLSQGFDDHAITATTLTAVHDYLIEIGCKQEYFMLVLGTIWFTNPDAKPAAPTAAALARQEGQGRGKARARRIQGTRLPELIIRVVFTGTAEDCTRGSDDVVYKEIRRQFHDLEINVGPFALHHRGFRLEVLASAEACGTHMWHDAATNQKTNATVITGLGDNTLAFDLLNLLFGKK